MRERERERHTHTHAQVPAGGVARLLAVGGEESYSASAEPTEGKGSAAEYALLASRMNHGVVTRGLGPAANCHT